MGHYLGPLVPDDRGRGLTVPNTLQLLTFALFFVAFPAVAFSQPEFSLSQGATIIAEGDSLTYGQDVSASGQNTQINGATQTRSPAPYPETLETELHGCAKVVNRGYPGDRSIDGFARWQGEDSADLYILMYGTNDALNYGNASTGRISVESFTQVLDLLVKRRQAKKAKVLLLVPPPLESAKGNKVLAPYQQAIRDYAQSHNLPFLDTPKLRSVWSRAWTEDGIHLSEAFNRRLAHKISSIVTCHSIGEVHSSQK